MEERQLDSSNVEYREINKCNKPECGEKNFY